LLTVMVEASSLFHAFNAPVITTAWAGCAVLLACIAGGLAWRRGALSGSALHEYYVQLQQRWGQPWTVDARLLVAGTGLIIVTLGVLAITIPTTNFDSMTYHMARVMHWLQQQSVAHYPTMNGRQLESGPWAEFGMATLYMLWGNDQFVNVIQWFSMLSSVIAASLVATQLLPGWGAAASDDLVAQPDVELRQRITAMTCVLVATLPIGVAQAQTTQNDYATACWLACLMCMVLALLYDPANLCYSVGAAGALGLGVLTKATMFLFAGLLVGILILVLLVRLRHHGLRLRLLLILTVTLSVLNAPHMVRNSATYGSPLGSRGTVEMQRNQDFSPGGIASNVIRNLSLHTATGIAPLTQSLNYLVLLAHNLTGKALDDKSTTFLHMPFQFQKKFMSMDSNANTPFHLLIIFVTNILLLLTRHAWRTRLLTYHALIIASFVLFCAYLRWQPWHSRFHLAYFILLMPSAALVLVTVLPRWVNTGLATCLICLVYVCLFNDVGRPINPKKAFLTLPREQQYFWQNRPLYTPYAQVADAIIASGCQQVGLKLGYDDWEYPLWILLHNRGFRGYIKHVYVTGEAAQLRTAVPVPCAVVVTGSSVPLELVSALPRSTAHSPLTVYWAAPANNP
jgi:hypothetical protein